MVSEKSEHKPWLDLTKEVFDQHHRKGGFQVLFPEYRPDLSRALANYLRLRFYDYRESVMQAQGWEAGKLSLESMTETLLEESAKTGLLVHNVEALLATKYKHERKQWLEDFFSVDWPNPVVVPITIFQNDTLKGHSRICDTELVEFPKQSFLMRLAM